MKRYLTAISMVVLLMAGVVHAQKGEKASLRNACSSIPQWALDQADESIKIAHPNWGAEPVAGDNGEWRCRTNGSYVRKYDKTVNGVRVSADIALHVEPNGGILVFDNGGCFSIDRWK